MPLILPRSGDTTRQKSEASDARLARVVIRVRSLGRLTSRRPWFVIAAWVVIAIAVVSLAPSLETTQEESEFLPDHYESIQAVQIQEEKFPRRHDAGAR